MIFPFGEKSIDRSGGCDVGETDTENGGGAREASDGVAGCCADAGRGVGEGGDDGREEGGGYDLMTVGFICRDETGDAE